MKDWLFFLILLNDFQKWFHAADEVTLRATGRFSVNYTESSTTAAEGLAMADVLVEEFPGIDAIVSAKPEELAKVKGFGPKRAQFVRAYFDSEAGKKVVAELKELGIKTTHDKKATPAGGLPLAGKTVVVTGTLVNYDRIGSEQAIKDAGGKPSGSVSKKTDFVLVGDSPGSKLAKAKELGVKIITEDEFRTLIGAG